MTDKALVNLYNSDLQNIQEIFEEEGYLIIRGVCTTELIALIRKKLDDYFELSDGLNTSLEFILGNPDFFLPILDNRLLNILQQLLGNSIRIYPNFTARNNTYSPWHVDEAFIHDKVAGEIQKTNFIQCSLFLQDNSIDYGGGIDVIPTSHRLQRYGLNLEALNENVHLFLKLKDKILTINSLPGDIIIWDGRLFHKSTKPVKNSFKSKYSLMWTVSRDDSNYIGFLNHLEHRSRQKLPNSETYDARYKEICSLKAIPDYLNEKFKARGVKMNYAN